MPWAELDIAHQASANTFTVPGCPLYNRNHKFASYCTNPMKTIKRRKRKLMIKLQSTTPTLIPPNASAQDSGSTESYPPYSLINRKFAPYSTTTTKNQKKKENKIGDKVTIDTTPDPDAPVSDTPTIPPKMLAPLTPILHIH